MVFKSIPLNAWRWFLFDPVKVGLLIIAAISCGAWAAGNALSIYRSLYPLEQTKGNISLSADRQWIIVAALGDDPIGCVRDQSNLLYPASDAELSNSSERHYIPLPSSQNGMVFPDAVPLYSLVIWVPPLLQGDYYFVTRSHYSCWHGLVRYNYTTAPPILFHLGAS